MTVLRFIDTFFPDKNNWKEIYTPKKFYGYHALHDALHGAYESMAPEVQKTFLENHKEFLFFIDNTYYDDLDSQLEAWVRQTKSDALKIYLLKSIYETYQQALNEELAIQRVEQLDKDHEALIDGFIATAPENQMDFLIQNAKNIPCLDDAYSPRQQKNLWLSAVKFDPKVKAYILQQLSFFKPDIVDEQTHKAEVLSMQKIHTTN